MFHKHIPLLIFVIGTIHSLSAKTEDNQLSSIKVDTHDLMHYAPIHQTKQGIHTFLSTTFNRPDYAQEILAVDLSHLAQLIEYVHETYKTRDHMRHTLRLCMNKCKTTSYLNAHAFSSLLTDVTPYFDDLLIEADITEFENSKGLIYSLMFDRFLHQFSSFQENHKLFLETLSTDIAQSFYTQKSLADITTDELRYAIFSFCDVCSSKLIWSPNDGIESWNITVKIADQLASYASQGILKDDDMLQDLCITLLERYCYFLDLVAQDLPFAFFSQVRNQCEQQRIELLDLEEQEKCLETKRHRFMRALLAAEAKNRVYETGQGNVTV